MQNLISIEDLVSGFLCVTEDLVSGFLCVTSEEIINKNN